MHDGAAFSERERKKKKPRILIQVSSAKGMLAQTLRGRISTQQLVIQATTRRQHLHNSFMSQCNMSPKIKSHSGALHLFPLFILWRLQWSTSVLNTVLEMMLISFPARWSYIFQNWTHWANFPLAFLTSAIPLPQLRWLLFFVPTTIVNLLSSQEKVPSLCFFSSFLTTINPLPF